MKSNDIKTRNKYKSNTMVDYYSTGNIDNEYNDYIDLKSLNNDTGFLNIIYMIILLQILDSHFSFTLLLY